VARSDDLEVIAGFLARRDVASLESEGLRRTFDVLVLCGSAVLASLDVTARAFHDGVVRRVLVSGGIGHSTPYLASAIRDHPAYAGVVTDGRPESAILAEILVRHLDVSPGALTTEDESTNCGENADLSLRTLAGGPEVRSILLVQDPTMQRRTHASFDRRLPDPAPMEVVSFAPFVPRVGPDGVGARADDPVWSTGRFTSLALGEVSRLRDDETGYGPRGAGFIGHVDVPEQVLAAYHRLRGADPGALADR
jgi:uncharacterized SAM-binding protein YcdF (DUF218 family)